MFIERLTSEELCSVGLRGRRILEDIVEYGKADVEELCNLVEWSGTAFGDL